MANTSDPVTARWKTSIYAPFELAVRVGIRHIVDSNSKTVEKHKSTVDVQC
jgi:hypothetical protein